MVGLFGAAAPATGSWSTAPAPSGSGSNARNSGGTISSRGARSPLLRRRSVFKGQGPVLERVLGITSQKNSSISVDPSSGVLAYLAGAVVVMAPPGRRQRQSHVINAAKKTFTAVAFSPDGSLLLTGEQGHQPALRLWNVKEKTQLSEFLAHTYGISCVAFAGNGKYAISIGLQFDKMVMVWDLKSKLKIASNKVSSKVEAMAVSPSTSQLAFVTVGNRHVKFWYLKEASSGRATEPRPLVGRSAILKERRNDFFVDVAFGRGANASFVYAVARGGVLCEFDEERKILHWVDMKTPLHSVCLNETHVFIGCANGFIRAFDAQTLVYAASLPRPHPLGVDVAKFPQSGLMSVSSIHGDLENQQFPDCVACVMDAEKQKITAVYSDHSLYIWDVQDIRRVGKNASFLFHSSTIFGLEVVGPDLSRRLRGGSGGFASAGADLSGSASVALPPGSFITCSQDDTIRFWNLDPSPRSKPSTSEIPVDPQSEDPLHPLDNPLACNRYYERNIFCHELLKILYSDPNYANLCEVDDAAAEEASREARAHPTSQGNARSEKTGIRSIRVSPSGDLLASGDRQGNVRIYDLILGARLIKEIESHDAEVLSLDFSPDDSGHRLLVSASRDRFIHLYDLNRDAEAVATLDDHSSSIMSVRFNIGRVSNALQLLSTGMDKSVIFRRVEEGVPPESIKIVQDHVVSEKNSIYDMECDVTRMSAVTACNDRKIRVYNVEKGKETKAFKGSVDDDGYLNCVTLDASSRFAATSSSEKSVTVVDLSTGETVASLTGHSKCITALRFLPDGRHLVSVSADSCVFVWRLPASIKTTMDKRLVELGLLDPSALNDHPREGARSSRRTTSAAAKSIFNPKPLGGVPPIIVGHPPKTMTHVSSLPGARKGGKDPFGPTLSSSPQDTHRISTSTATPVASVAAVSSFAPIASPNFDPTPAPSSSKSEHRFSISSLPNWAKKVLRNDPARSSSAPHRAEFSVDLATSTAAQSKGVGRATWETPQLVIAARDEEETSPKRVAEKENDNKENEDRPPEPAALLDHSRDSLDDGDVEPETRDDHDEPEEDEDAEDLSTDLLEEEQEDVVYIEDDQDLASPCSDPSASFEVHTPVPATARTRSRLLDARTIANSDDDDEEEEEEESSSEPTTPVGQFNGGRSMAKSFEIADEAEDEAFEHGPDFVAKNLQDEDLIVTPLPNAFGLSEHRLSLSARFLSRYRSADAVVAAADAATVAAAESVAASSSGSAVRLNLETEFRDDGEEGLSPESDDGGPFSRYKSSSLVSPSIPSTTNSFFVSANEASGSRPSRGSDLETSTASGSESEGAWLNNRGVNASATLPKSSRRVHARDSSLGGVGGGGGVVKLPRRERRLPAPPSKDVAEERRQSRKSSSALTSITPSYARSTESRMAKQKPTASLAKSCSTTGLHRVGVDSTAGPTTVMDPEAPNVIANTLHSSPRAMSIQCLDRSHEDPLQQPQVAVPTVREKRKSRGSRRDSHSSTDVRKASSECNLSSSTLEGESPDDLDSEERRKRSRNATHPPSTADDRQTAEDARPLSPALSTSSSSSSQSHRPKNRNVAALTLKSTIAPTSDIDVMKTTNHVATSVHSAVSPVSSPRSTMVSHDSALSDEEKLMKREEASAPDAEMSQRRRQMPAAPLDTSASSAPFCFGGGPFCQQLHSPDVQTRRSWGAPVSTSSLAVVRENSMTSPLAMATTLQQPQQIRSQQPTLQTTQSQLTVPPTRDYNGQEAYMGSKTYQKPPLPHNQPRPQLQSLPLNQLEAPLAQPPRPRYGFSAYAVSNSAQISSNLIPTTSGATSFGDDSIISGYVEPADHPRSVNLAPISLTPHATTTAAASQHDVLSSAASAVTPTNKRAASVHRITLPNGFAVLPQKTPEPASMASSPIGAAVINGEPCSSSPHLNNHCINHFEPHAAINPSVRRGAGSRVRETAEFFGRKSRAATVADCAPGLSRGGAVFNSGTRTDAHFPSPSPTTHSFPLSGQKQQPPRILSPTLPDPPPPLPKTPPPPLLVTSRAEESVAMSPSQEKADERRREELLAELRGFAPRINEISAALTAGPESAAPFDEELRLLLMSLMISFPQAAGAAIAGALKK